MPELLTRATGRLSSFDPETRTIDAVLATETPVRRRSFEDGLFDEILVCAPAALDTARMDSMALLDSHDSWSIDSRLGTVVPGSLRFEGRQAIVTIMFSRNERADALMRDLEDGHRLSVSVGYRILDVEKTEAPSGGVATVRATKWQPMELSVVAVPADPNAQTRQFPREENPMTETQTITRAEKKRIAEIHAVARMAKIDVADDLVTRAIEEDTSVDGFRDVVIEHLMARENETPTNGLVIPRTTGHTNLESQVAARTDSLVARMTGRAPEGEGRAFMGATLMDHARGLLEARGVNTSMMSREEILGYRGMHTASDFPLLLQAAGERVLMSAYQLAESPLKSALARRGTATDFRPKTKLKVSDAGLLEKVSESGEIRATTRAESAESYAVESFGRIFALSFKAIVNDDLGAFGDWSTQAGRMAAQTEAKLLFELLVGDAGNGPVMGEDNKTLFHAGHENLLTGAALDVAGLSVARKSFRGLKAPGGEKISVAPKFLLVGSELETDAEKVLAVLAANTVSEQNPFAGKLELVVEPRIEDKSWYLFADPAAQPVFEWSYLSGYEGPQIDSRDGFERLGTEFRAVLHFGAGAIDWRGAVRNPGL
ncbi:prohead protease/major capsid protein fusion protein [Martelella sp. FOR1707]